MRQGNVHVHVVLVLAKRTVMCGTCGSTDESVSPGVPQCKVV